MIPLDLTNLLMNMREVGLVDTKPSRAFPLGKAVLNPLSLLAVEFVPDNPAFSNDVVLIFGKAKAPNGIVVLYDMSSLTGPVDRETAFKIAYSRIM